MTLDLNVHPSSIAFAPKHNTRNRKDADYFRRLAAKFLERHGCPKDNLFIFDNHASRYNRRAYVRDVIRGQNPVGDTDKKVTVAFFSHGYKNGMQAGFRIRHIRLLAEAIKGFAGDKPFVPLYACDTARDLDKERVDDLGFFGGDGGFADMFRDGLCKAGATLASLDAHTTAGDAAKNPNVRRFLGMGSTTGGVGGFYIIHHDTPLWQAWRELLRTDFRLDFPFMTVGQIHQHVINSGI